MRAVISSLSSFLQTASTFDARENTHANFPNRITVVLLNSCLLATILSNSLFACTQVAKTGDNSHSAPPQVKKYSREYNNTMQVLQQFTVNTHARFFETLSSTVEVTLLDD